MQGFLFNYACCISVYNVTYMQQFGGASGKVNHVCNEYKYAKADEQILYVLLIGRLSCGSILLAFRCKRLEEVMNLVVSCTLAKFSPVQLSSGTNKFISFIGELVLHTYVVVQQQTRHIEKDKGSSPVLFPLL